MFLKTYKPRFYNPFLQPCAKLESMRSQNRSEQNFEVLAKG